MSLQGDGKFNTFTAGVGFKGGVDFMPYEDFTIQPNLSLIYSYMESKTFENKAGTIISSGGLHAVQLSPSIKMMKNFDKQINSYLDLRGVFNLQNNPNSKADEYLLPKTALGAYGEVAIGVSRDYGNMSFFAQGTLRAFRREGYGVESGFRVKF